MCAFYSFQTKQNIYVLVNGLCHGLGRPYANSGYYAPPSYSPSEDARPRTINHGLSSLKNDEAKSQASAVLAHNVMPTPANQFDRDLVATSHSLAFVVRDPGLQHQDIVSFLANEKRLSQNQKPDVAKTDTYMYEFWQNTQLPVVHWMPLGASDTDHQQSNSWKSLPEQQQLVDHTQQSNPLSAAATTLVPAPTARVPLTLLRPLNQNSPFSNGSKTLKKKRICRRPGVCRGMATGPRDVPSATVPTLPAYVDTTEPIATSFPKFQVQDHTQMISTAPEPEVTLSSLKKQSSTSMLESTTSESTPHPLAQDTRTESGKVDLLAQWPFNAMRNVSKFRSRVRPYHRSQGSYKVGNDSNDALNYTSSSPLFKESITKGQSSDVSIAEVANLDKVEDSISSRQEMETTVSQSKGSLSSLFPRRDPSRLSYAEILRNKISASPTQEQKARPAGIINRRLPSRSTTPSPKQLSILRSVRPNSTYPLRHGSSPRPFPPSRKTTGAREKTVNNKSKWPNSGKLALSSKSNSRFPAHRHLNQPSRFNRKSSSLDDPISESDTSSWTEEPNFSTIPGDRFHDDLFRQDENLDTMTENPTPGTNQTTSTSAAPFAIHQTSTEEPSTTTKQSDIPRAQSSISQVMQIRSESHSEIHVKQITEQLASRDTNNPVKPHTDSATRVSKAVTLFNDSHKPSTSDILAQSEPKSISDRQAQFLILQAPTRRPTIFKGNIADVHPTVETTLPSSPTFLNESRTVFSSTTLATILPPSDSIMDKTTPSHPIIVVATLPKISTVLAERTVFIRPDTIATTLLPRLPSSTSLHESITLPSSTTEATTLFPISNRMEEWTISYRLTTDATTLAAQEAQTPYPFAIRTTESTNPHRLAIISRKSAIASNLRKTPSSTTALRHAVEDITTTRSTTPGSLPTPIPTTTTLSPRASFLEMLRTASHRLENKPVSRSRSYASIVVHKPSVPILNISYLA